MIKVVTRFPASVVVGMAALAGVLFSGQSAQAVVFLDANTFSDYCEETYGAGAQAEGPTAGSGTAVSLQCIAGSGETHELEVDVVCHELTGHVTWVNDRGSVVCLGREAFGQNEGRGSFNSPN